MPDPLEFNKTQYHRDLTTYRTGYETELANVVGEENAGKTIKSSVVSDLEVAEDQISRMKFSVENQITHLDLRDKVRKKGKSLSQIDKDLSEAARSITDNLTISSRTLEKKTINDIKAEYEEDGGGVFASGDVLKKIADNRMIEKAEKKNEIPTFQCPFHNDVYSRTLQILYDRDDEDYEYFDPNAYDNMIIL